MKPEQAELQREAARLAERRAGKPRRCGDAERERVGVEQEALAALEQRQDAERALAAAAEAGSPPNRNRKRCCAPRPGTNSAAGRAPGGRRIPAPGRRRCGAPGRT
jgi:hypothetical protein